MTITEQPESTETQALAGPSPSRLHTAPRINRVVLLGSGALILGVSVWAIVAPTHAGETIGALTGWISTWFGWWYFALAAIILVFVIVLALGRYGSVRLGPDHSRPQFSLFTWSAMLFAAGIGTDLMFYAVAEPAAQYLAPPVIEGNTVQAAREAVVWTLFHYGVIGWGMYALMGMALAYFTHRKGMPLSIRSALHALFGERIWGRWGHLVDGAAVIGTVFGLAATLGIGVSMLSRGLSILTGIPDSLIVQIALIVVAVVTATISTISGVARGVRRLSELQTWISFGLLAFVLITGNTGFLLNGLVMNLGDYIASLPRMTLDTMAFEAPAEWLNAWTLFFWAWWVAWAPFVGLFLARISRGRTIRQFVLGTLTIPFVFVLLWASIFGNTTLGIIRDGSDTGATFGEAAMNDPAGGLFGMLEHLPWAPLTIAVAIVTGLLFFITSADSGSLVLARLSVDPRSTESDAPPWLRSLWSVLVGLVTLGMILAGGLTTLQSGTMIMGLPFSFVLCMVMIGLWRALAAEGRKLDSARTSLPSTIAGRSTSGGWRSRLHRLMSFPGPRAVRKFVDTIAKPALEEVSAELCSRDVPALTEVISTGPEAPERLRLTANHGDADAFVYELVPTRTLVPSFASKVQEDAPYYRLEVHLSDGARGYDVVGWSQSQLIDDVLDQYERHLAYLQAGITPSLDTTEYE